MANSLLLGSGTPASTGEGTIEKASDFGNRPEDQVAYWLAQDNIAYDKSKEWLIRGRKIVDRYRDKRDAVTAMTPADHRYNVLWSNVQTLTPALYARTPKPDVDRRFKDEDDVGNLAAILLERALSYSMDMSNFDGAMRSCVSDLLLPGRGVMRMLYVPHYGDEIPEPESDDTSGSPETVDTGGDEQTPKREPMREVVGEEVCGKYIFWEDYSEGPARKWEDVPWVKYRAFLTRAELVSRFKSKGQLVKLDSNPHNSRLSEKEDQVSSLFKKAEIWEIWDRTDKRVIWLAPSSQNLGILDQVDDPLGLPGFFPSPDPLLATTTNDQRIPVPDYAEYQDQASELDNITGRIDLLLKALRVAGVYAGEEKQVLQQLMNGSMKNEMIPVEDWAAFTTDKGGINALIQWLPIEQVASTVIQLYNARDRVKEVLYEITGMSDIMRGASDPGETATAQQIKAQFGTMRLNERQRLVSEFARDNIRIMAAIIAGQFSPKTISAMTGYPQLKPVPQIPPQLQQPVMDPQTGMPGPNPQLQVFQQQVVIPVLVENQQKQAQFDAACKLLKDDMPHGFRIDVEADSTIAPDEQAEKQARVEFTETVVPAIMQMIQGVQMNPVMAEAAKETAMFLIRGFKAGRTLEETYEKLFDQMGKQPPQPPPGQGGQEGAAQAAGAQAKAQADVQSSQIKAQTEGQRIQAEAQTSSQATQADAAVKMQTAQQQAAIEAQNNRANQALQAQKLQQDGAFKAADLQLKQQDMEMRAEAERRRELKAASAEAGKLT